MAVARQVDGDQRPAEGERDGVPRVGVLRAPVQQDELGILQQQSTAVSTLIRDTGTTFATIGSNAARTDQLITARQRPISRAASDP